MRRRFVLVAAQLAGAKRGPATPPLRLFSSVTKDIQLPTSTLSSKFEAGLRDRMYQSSDLEKRLEEPLPAQEASSISKQLAEIRGLVSKYKEIESCREEFRQTREMLASSKGDPGIAELAEAELAEIEERLFALEEECKNLAIPKDPADDGNAIVEIRPGAGGDEAALFAMDLVRLYENYSLFKGWRFEKLMLNVEMGKACKEAMLAISGEGVFRSLKFESGVHRVQRVPATEAAGRVHTSTASVAILPEAKGVDLSLEDRDIRVETMRASGAGGQHVNKTDSAVRMTHIPTGIQVVIQDERSQIQNRAKALQVLRAKLYSVEREKLQAQRAQDRREQIGQASRSEKIRTYNMHQCRIVDHRIGATVHNIEGFFEGGEIFDDLIQKLVEDERERAMDALG